MPIEGMKLIIEPSYPGGKELAAIGAPVEEQLPEGTTLRNAFYSRRDRCDILIWNENGKVEWGRIPAFHHLGYDLNTLGASDVWGIEQESNAVQTLAGLVRYRQMKQYLLTGMFLETSTRSRLTYLFRRLKPTVVLDIRTENPPPVYDIGETESQPAQPGGRVLCTLCMHPIAYYQGSWAGAMCPTDDVLAHLMLMRGDEPMLWRRANQHAPHRPESGL